MLCDHCGDCYELLTDVRVVNCSGSNTHNSTF